MRVEGSQKIVFQGTQDSRHEPRGRYRGPAVDTTNAWCLLREIMHSLSVNVDIIQHMYFRQMREKVKI